MAETILVKPLSAEDRASEAAVLDVLARIKCPVSLCDWKYFHEYDEWRLLIATPWYESMGPLDATKQIFNELKKSPDYKKLPMLRISVYSSKDPLVLEMQENIKNRLHDDTMIGFVSIAKHENTSAYSVIFAPQYSGIQGGTVSAIQVHPNDLEKFLSNVLRIKPSMVQDAMFELKNNSSTEIYPVSLSIRKARQLGLKWQRH